MIPPGPGFKPPSLAGLSGDLIGYVHQRHVTKRWENAPWFVHHRLPFVAFSETFGQLGAKSPAAADKFPGPNTQSNATTAGYEIVDV
mmetsp:Transcript_56933/g.94464  ORF Transcript_56933/g.94464 Transcript_56933/m.94464 type:complete len:87 (+) Transcript_56933:70-330(+)